MRVETTGPGPAAAVRSPARRGRLDLGPTDHGSQRRERVVGDLTRPHEIPQRREQLLVLRSRRGGADLAPEARTLLGEQRPDRLLQHCPRRGRALPSRVRAARVGRRSRAGPDRRVRRARRRRSRPPHPPCTARRASAAGKPTTRTGRTSVSIVEATSAVPDSTPSVSTSASIPRRLARDAVPAP